MRQQKLTLEEYHNWYKNTYKFISNIHHESHYKSVVRGGEAYVVSIDGNGNDIKED